MVNVDVQSADTAVPLANADHVRVVAGSKTIISPLDNDSSPTGEELRLAGVSEAPVGTTVDVDMQADVLTFLSEQPQTYYLTYDAIVGAATSQGVIRVDVVERSDPSVPRRSKSTPPCCATADQPLSPPWPTTSTLPAASWSSSPPTPRRTRALR